MALAPLRVLCLHGRKQIGNVFEKRLETTIRRLRTQTRTLPPLEWIFIDAPFFEIDSPSEGQKTWWRSSNDEHSYARDLQTSLTLLSLTISERQPHIIVSFSQGCALVAEAANAGMFDESQCPNLMCLVFAGGLLPTFYRAADKSMLERLPTLHFAGIKDQAVDVETSRKLADVFVQSTFVEHQQGHCFPSRASESQTLISFLETTHQEKSDTAPDASALHAAASPAAAPPAAAPPAAAPPTLLVPSEELLEELESLQYIFAPEEYSVVDETTKRVSVRVKHKERTIELMFGFTDEYPETASLSLVTGDLIGCTKSTVRSALSRASDVLLETEGSCQVYSVVTAVRDYLEEERDEELDNGSCCDEGVEGMEKRKRMDPSSTGSAVAGSLIGSNNEEEDEKEKLKKKKKIVLTVENGMISHAALAELTREAAARMKMRHERRSPKGGGPKGGPKDKDEILFRPRRRKSMYWGDFTIGLVGKPSAGKSTFFNACKTMGTNAAKIGSFPFTTIEANVGRAAARFTWPDVVQTKEEEGGETGETGGRTFSMEIFVKDVAGLVKGAYQGRGRGNRFLDDLCSADVLVHVLDGSGDTDDEGNSGTDMGRPTEDVEWVYAEIHRWISDNVLAKWHAVVRKNTRDSLGSLFTGYRNVKEDVDQSALLAGLEVEDRGGGERSPFSDWKKEDVHRLVCFFLRWRFPIIIGFNKCDDERSIKHLFDVREKYGDEVIVPMSAAAELVLLRRMEEMEEEGEEEGEGEGEEKRALSKRTPKKEAALKKEEIMMKMCMERLGGTTGVSECVDRAVSMQRPIVIHVVHVPLTSSSGIVLTPADVVPLLFRRGVTPHDVYRYLLHTERPEIRLTGDFVRAEYVSRDGARIVIKKNKPIDEDNQTVLKIYTAKTSAWQKNGSGGGGPSGGCTTAPKKKSSSSAKGGGGSGGSGGGGGTDSNVATGGRAEKRIRDRNRLIQRLHKSSDRQGKSKGGKGTGQDRRVPVKKS